MTTGTGTNIEYYTVARAGEIAPGRVKQIFIDDMAIAVCNVGGEFFAISDVCTHDDYYLSAGYIDTKLCEIECPMHATVFSIRTGEVVVPPAEKPLPTFPCRVVGDEVQVGVAVP